MGAKVQGHSARNQPHEGSGKGSSSSIHGRPGKTNRISIHYRGAALPLSGMFMSIVLWAQVAVFTHVISDEVDDWDRWFLGRAPRTRVTLPDFRESCRVARHSRVFRGLTGSQRTPGFWGVTAWYHSIGTRVPRA